MSISNLKKEQAFLGSSYYETYPCWLSKDELEQAEVLLNLGYYYAGNFSQEDDEDEYGDVFVFPKIATEKGWTFYAGTGQSCLIAEIKGASYVCHTKDSQEFKCILESSFRLLKDCIKKQELESSKTLIQLALF